MFRLSRHRIIVIASIAATGLLLWLDAQLPRGIMDGYFYFLVMLACLLLPGSRVAFIYAAVLSGAVFFGFWLSKEMEQASGVYWLGFENCLIAVAILWITATIISAYKRKERDLAKARLRLEAMNHEKAKFFSIMAHDMRGPAQALLSFSEMMFQTQDDREKTRLAAGNIHTISFNLVALLDNLLVWGRMQMGQAAARPRTIALKPLVHGTCTLLQPNATAKGVLLTERIGNTAVHADPDMAQAVIRNLVGNAIKFTPSGGSVAIKAWTEGTVTRLAVSDTGVGMSPSQVAALFKPAETVSSPGTAGEAGTGLGLALCFDMIVAHSGGTITVDSTVGVGTTVTVALPAG